MATTQTAIEVTPDHLSDLTVISNALWAEKTNRSWCSDFESITEPWNNQLVGTLPAPKKIVRQVINLSIEIDADIPEGESGRVAQDRMYLEILRPLYNKYNVYSAEYVPQALDTIVAELKNLPGVEYRTSISDTHTIVANAPTV